MSGTTKIDIFFFLLSFVSLKSINKNAKNVYEKDLKYQSKAKKKKRQQNELISRTAVQHSRTELGHIRYETALINMYVLLHKDPCLKYLNVSKTISPVTQGVVGTRYIVTFPSHGKDKE